MTPLDRYQSWVENGRLEADRQQESVLHYLTQIQQQLLRRQQFYQSVFGKLIRRIKPLPPIQGLYLWGGVGAGKTMLMDCFYETLPVYKLRLHFHAFMQRLHQELRESQGQVNPLTAIGRRLANKYSVICFDEFLVTNIADAMLLGELFKALFNRGVCLVATANLPPDRLYENGLQRQHFLPAIHLIQRHTQVFHLLTIHDYRRRVGEHISTYYTPLGEEAEQALQQAFTHFANNHLVSSEPLRLFDRKIVIKQQAGQVIWFEFNILCGRPRSQADYLALAEQYAVILVSNVPCLETVANDLVVSFIHLVDILYDKKVRLILSAATPIAELYTRGPFHPIFQRTESRLTEMQLLQYTQ